MQFAATADKVASAGSGSSIDYSGIARPKKDTRVQTAVIIIYLFIYLLSTYIIIMIIIRM